MLISKHFKEWYLQLFVCNDVQSLNATTHSTLKIFNLTLVMHFIGVQLNHLTYFLVFSSCPQHIPQSLHQCTSNLPEIVLHSKLNQNIPNFVTSGYLS